MNESIVAMFGWIIPEPFAMPVTVIGTPSTMVRREAPFGTVSVVMIARAALNQPSARAAACAIGNADTIRSNGNGSMITPVENGSTSSGAQRKHLADRGARRTRCVQSRLTGTGIRVAGVDDQRAKRSHRCDAGTRDARGTR